MDKNNTVSPSEEQMRYADLLRILSRSGLVFLIGGFFIYVSGLVPVITPLEQVPNLLQLRATDFIRETGMPTGWDWINNLGKGEVISNLGVLYLSFATIICFLAILPIAVKKRDISYTTIIIMEIIILILATCGILTVGMH